MARLPQKVDARYERLKRAEREGGPVLLSKATMRHVAEAAADGQLAFFGDALAREYALRHRSRIARLRRQANFPSQKGFDGFEWPGIVFPRGFTRDDMLSLALIDAHEDLALFGGSGNGETHTAIALGLLACGEGGKVAFWSTAGLVSELRRANKEGTAQDALRRLGRCGLIILDEWGHLPTDPDGARLLFRVVSMCYERIAPILTIDHHPIRRKIMFVSILGDKVLDELLTFVRRGVFTAKSGLYGLRKTEDAVLSRREIGESASKENLNLSDSAEHNETQIAVKLIGTHNLGEARILTEYSLSP